jgi:ABC-type Na+ transport system ATPase subunit NatA
MRPDAGTIPIDGRDAPLEPLAGGAHWACRPIPAVYKRLTARENIEYFAALRPVTNGAAAEKH